MTLDEQRRALLAELQQQFGVKFLWHEKLEASVYRDDVSVHTFWSGSHSKPNEQTKREVRRWTESRGWQFSRQVVENRACPGRRIEYVFLAPMIAVHVDRGYHATRLVSVPSIQTDGLVPSTPERQTTDRSDCEGNIYICDALGTLADAGVRGSKSAHWWRDHLARNNRFNDPEWGILEVEVGRVQGAKLYRDIWSESGIVVGGVDVIPSELIRVVYRPGA